MSDSVRTAVQATGVALVTLGVLLLVRVLIGLVFGSLRFRWSGARSKGWRPLDSPGFALAVALLVAALLIALVPDTSSRNRASDVRPDDTLPTDPGTVLPTAFGVEASASAFAPPSTDETAVTLEEPAPPILVVTPPNDVVDARGGAR